MGPTGRKRVLRAVKVTEAAGPCVLRQWMHTSALGAPAWLEPPAGQTPPSMCVSEASGTDPRALNLVCCIFANWSGTLPYCSYTPLSCELRTLPQLLMDRKGVRTPCGGGAAAPIWPPPVAHPRSACPSHQSPAGLGVADPTHSTSQDPQ